MGFIVPITIQAIEVEDIGSDNVKLPILLNENNLPVSHMKEYAKIGFDDLRAYSDTNDVNRLPLEVVSDASDDKPEVWVSGVEISPTSNVTFYIRYGESTWSLPAVNEEFGRNHTWGNFAGSHDEFLAVYHFDNDPSGSSPQLTDSTGKNNDMTSAGSMNSGDLVDSKIGKGWNFDGIDDHATLNNAVINDIASFYFMSWVNIGDASTKTIFCDGNNSSNDNVILFRLEDNFKFDFRSAVGVWYGNSTTATVDDNDDHHIALTQVSKANKTSYIDSVSDASDNGDYGSISPNISTIGAFRRTSIRDYYKQEICEIQITSTNRSDNWIKTEYNSHDDPGSFAIKGSVLLIVGESQMNTIERIKEILSPLYDTVTDYDRNNTDSFQNTYANVIYIGDQYNGSVWTEKYRITIIKSSNFFSDAKNIRNLVETNESYISGSGNNYKSVEGDRNETLDDSIDIDITIGAI